MKVIKIEQLDNDYRVKLTLNRIRTYIPRENQIRLNIDGEVHLYKVLKCDIENKTIEAKKFNPCIYAWTTESYKLNNVYKVGLVNWQSVCSRMKQTFTTGVLEKIEVVETFNLDVYDSKSTHDIEKEIHNRIGLKTKGREAVQGDWKEEIRPAIVDVINEFKATLISPNTITPLSPRYYQYHASLLANDYYKENDRGWIQWACGSGKSFGGYWIWDNAIKSNAKNNLVVILVPNRQLVKQTHDDWMYVATSHGDKFKSIKIGGVENAIDNVEEIKRWLDNITSDTLNVVVSTYQSSNKIMDALRLVGLKADFVINDEVHRITGENTKSWKKCLLDSHLPSYKRLSMTASPIEYTTESLGFSGMENIQLFGNKFHQYLTLDAIFDNYISPIEIYGIEASPNIVHDIKQKINANRNIIQRNLINTDKSYDFSEIEDEVNIDEGNPTFYISLHNTLIALQQELISHPVIYANSTKRIRMFMACLIAMAPEYGVNIGYSEVFTSKDKIDKRIKNLKIKFSKAKVAVAGNVYCLQEGISVDAIDSTILIDPRSSGPAIIQILGRPVRLDNNNKNKIARIFIPVILEKDKQGKIIIDNAYFKTTRDWMLAITGADEDFSTLMIEDFRFFTNKSRQGIEVRNILPRNGRTSVSGRNRNLDRTPQQLEVVDFNDIKKHLKLSTLITPSKTANIKRNTEDGKQIYLERQAITFVRGYICKIKNYINNYNPRQISHYSKIINTKENYISDFAQFQDIDIETSKYNLEKANLKELINILDKLKAKNINAAFSTI